MNKSLVVVSVCVVAVVVLSGCCADTYSGDSDTITYTNKDGTTFEMDQNEYICKYDSCFIYFGSYVYNPTTEICQCYNDKGTYLYSSYLGDDCEVAEASCEDDCYYWYGRSGSYNYYNCMENCEWSYEDCVAEAEDDDWWW